MITDLRDLLNAIGYDKLIDDGVYWRTSAVYRDGDNKTALRINKRTGQFTDFVDKQYGSIEDLIKITLRIGDAELKNFYQTNLLDVSNIVERDDKPKLTMEKTWSEDELTNLQPHYRFYEDRGISKETLKFFKSGFAHSGNMNQRYIFPIYNQEGKIHGWSGRDMTGYKDAKWKHIGKKASWIYPAFMPLVLNTPQGPVTTYPVIEEINRTKEVILVESIGDMISLWEKGQRNVLVTFGLVMSGKLGAFLMSLSLNKIVIGLNNDVEGDINRGRRAAVDMFIDLMHYTDLEKITICLPTDAKDFGEMDDKKYSEWAISKSMSNSAQIFKEALEELRARYREGEITQSEIKFGKTIKDHYEQTEGYQA